MQTSTVISDFILAAFAAWTGFRLHGNWNKQSGAWGFYSIAIGAALGSLFFAGVTVIEPIYRIVIRFAAEVGVPWIGLAFFVGTFGRISRRNWITISLFLVLMSLVDRWIGLGDYSTFIGALSFITIIVSCVKRYNGAHKPAAMYGILGSLLFIFAGLAIGTVGEAAGILKVDIYHFVLAGACYCLGFSLKRLG
ncbi:putative membrane protein [Leptospira broomii serovar Hurstbridge str. 5399]|uniref:Membrane protein n=1 Tax=Leptospira broomii serovar Hurstbridge str. 5399 TaxID=1049789 RepID=T0FA19_9LEPT|nr:hypothetical protein [Leptospira broomii]EQA44402.1 putative membrane protein [Leptospira broomii serovar Hurstbridge str. 5399]